MIEIKITTLKTLFKNIFISLISFFLPLSVAVGLTGTGPGCKPGELCNPLTGVDNLGDLAVKILDAVVKVGGYVAVIFIIYSGFLFVKAQGNPTELENAKKTFFYTIIGVMILLGAKAISIGVAQTIKAITL
ncbi:MAG: hypothetical protein AAB488_00270 [Patescibacteria group bacterium]